MMMAVMLLQNEKRRGKNKRKADYQEKKEEASPLSFRDKISAFKNRESEEK